MSMITSYLHRVSLKSRATQKALLESFSYWPWEALDPKAVQNVRGAISCPQFIIVMPLDWCVIDACKTTTICNGLRTWIISTARIHTSTTRSLWTTSLASSWVLDCTNIADAVTATRAGSFMDGSATPTNCKDRWGQPVTDHPVSALHWHMCTSRTMISKFLFSNMVDLSRQDPVLQPRARMLAHRHDAFTALHISCMTYHSQVMTISQCNAQVFDCSRCLGGLAVDKRNLKAELLRFEAT